ncbi:MAG: hypothetical protein JRM99_07765 [Nitrososphaerota archaeon]|nr:hypothetical protein [Nitrososphaerota archaeon]
MKIPQKKAVSPIIATLLLIAIAVAAGIIVYVFVGSLSGSLTKSGGNQVTEQLSLNAYNFPLPETNSNNLTLFIQNTGTGTVTLASLFYDGTQIPLASGTHWLSSSCPRLTVANQLTTGSTCSISILPASTPSAGTSHTVKVITVDGGTFSFNVVAGSSG